MAVENVPWMVGGGVQHSTNVARLLTYAAFGGDEGIIGPRDLEVAALDIPGTSVQVFKGACAINNRWSGADYEAYACRATSNTQVPIANNNGASVRHDMVIARVVNPFLTTEDNEPAAGTEQDYPYFRLEVISGVGATDETIADTGYGYSAIPLARIRIPASTGTITQGDITDLRRLTAVRQSETFNVIAPTVERKLLSSTYVNWPSEGNMSVQVPEWATHMQARAILGGIAYGEPGANGGAGWNVYGNVRIQLGSGGDVVTTQNTSYNLSTSDGMDRATIMAGSPGIKVPEAMRGTTQDVQIMGMRSGDNGTSIRSDVASMVSLEVKFTQAPESNVA